jgi:bacillithiol biosynthesis cysteine-adding enzyme BshC
VRVNDAGPNQRPVGLIPIVEPPLEELRAALSSFPFGDQAVAMAEQAYRPGTSFGAAFQTLLKQLLSGHEILFLDPLDEPIRQLAAPLLREAVLASSGLTKKLLERNKELESLGYHAQVHVEPQTSLVFALEGDRRITLRRQNGDFISKEKRFTSEELADRAEHLSPNALLRPVVQDYLLPTVAHIGGPAELAYISQSQVLYEELLGRMPVEVSRTGFTLLDARSSKLMERYGLTIPSFFHGEENLRELIAHKLMPADLIGEFEQAREATASSLDKLRADVTAFDSTLAAALDKSRAKILYQFSKMEQKTARETFRRNERAAADAGFMANLVFPEKHLQERYYSILPFVAKHGPGLVDLLHQSVHLGCPDHKVLVV